MRLEHFLDWLPLVTLLAMMFARRLRALAMYRGGVRAIIVDLRRPLKQRLYDTLMIVVSIFLASRSATTLEMSAATGLFDS